MITALNNRHAPRGTALTELFDNGHARDRLALRLVFESVRRGYADANAARDLERIASHSTDFGLAALYRSSSVSHFMAARKTLTDMLDRHSRTSHGNTVVDALAKIRRMATGQLEKLVADLTIKHIKEAYQYSNNKTMIL